MRFQNQDDAVLGTRRIPSVRRDSGGPGRAPAPEGSSVGHGKAMSILHPAGIEGAPSQPSLCAAR
jgi:hypothetical protein